MEQLTSAIKRENIILEEPSSVPTIPFEFNAAYKGDALVRRVMEVLQLKSNIGWSIVDTFENLALIHYDKNADMETCGKLRGILVDTETGAIVANSFGYTPTAVVTELSDDNGSLVIKDKDNVIHAFPLQDTMIKRVFEGVVIRVIWYKGKSYHLTHKKINPVRSRWGSSPSFMQMYVDAGGPTDDQLFDTTKSYSNSCYVFLISHPALLVGTRQKINKPYIVCLAHYHMDIQRPSEEVSVGIPSYKSSDHISGSVTESFIHNPKSLTISEANRHLKYGYYNEFNVEDERQLTGEGVIIYRMIDTGVIDIVKVHSPSYEWRINLRGNQSNITFQFYSLLNIAYRDIDNDMAWNALKEKLIILPQYDEESLKILYEQNECIITIPSDSVSKDDYYRRDARIHLLWMNYILSLPSNVQKIGLDILSQFHKDRTEVVQWLQNLELSIRDIDNAEISDRAKDIIKASRKLAKERIFTGNNTSSRGIVMNLPAVIKTTIRNLIYKENGPSLYRLIRQMKQSSSDDNSDTSNTNTDNNHTSNTNTDNNK